MSGKHRSESARLTANASVPERDSRSLTMRGLASTSLLCAMSLAALVANVVEPQTSSDNAASIQPTPQVARPVSQEGTLIAVSADSLTARSANGYTQTYLVTPNTAVITGRDAHALTATSPFAVNQHVDIVGMIQGGTTLATAVAYRETGHGGGPPMDYGD